MRNSLSRLFEALFPAGRMESDFPLVYWFVGLWFYLKSFLYVCYVYMIGLEPAPYSTGTIVEIAYFSVATIPAFILGMALWHEKKWVRLPSVAFLALDTPLLMFHIYLLAIGGFLDSGLTKVLEIGSLAVNFLAFAWLVTWGWMAKTRSTLVETSSDRRV